MQLVTVNGKDYEHMEEVHAYLADKLDFPGYYGNNLSALYDVLTEICEDTRIVIDLTGMEDDGLADALERMAEVMADAADANEYLEFSCVE